MKMKYLLAILFIFILSIGMAAAADTDGNSTDIDDNGTDVDPADIDDNSTDIDDNGTDVDPADTDDNSTDIDDNGTDVEPADNRTIIGHDVVKYYKNDTQYEVEVFDENHTKLNNTIVEFTINGNTYIRNVTDGIARMNINLNPGEYQITAKSSYDNATVTNNITVLTTLLSSDLTKYFKNASQFQATLLNGTGSPEADVNVTININGVFYKRTTNKNGTANLNINLNPGEYILTAERDDNGLKMSSKVTVLPTLFCEDLTKFYRNASQFKATVLNGTGSPEADLNVTININGVFYKRTSDKNGTVNFNINLDPGEYVLTVERDDTGLKKSSTVTVLSNLFCDDLVKYFKNASQVKAKVLDDTGNPLANAPVTFNINGVFYNRESDSEGNVELAINLQPGDYVLTAERMDTHLKKSASITVLPKLTGKDVNMCLEGKTYSVKLVDDTGKPDSGKTVTGTINGKTFYATTNSEGIATFDLSVLTRGTYTITSSYADNVISNSLLVEPGTLQVIRNIGNPNGKKIAYVVGLHPLEHLTHEELLKILPTIPGLNYCYDIYVINVLEDIGYYGDGSPDNSQGRQNGQNIAQKYVLPQILNGGYELAIDVHSNVGYGVPVFVFSPVTGGAGERYARTVASNSPSIGYYQISTTSSGPYLTIPLNRNGVPAFYYEEYSFEPQASKEAHMYELIYAVDGLKF